jgi:hypothetical protein
MSALGGGNMRYCLFSVTFALLFVLCSLPASAQWEREDLDFGISYLQMAWNSPEKGVGFIITCTVRGAQAGKLTLETKFKTGGHSLDGKTEIEFILDSRPYEFESNVKMAPDYAVLTMEITPTGDARAEKVYDFIKSLEDGVSLDVRARAIGLEQRFDVRNAKQALIGIRSCPNHVVNRQADSSAGAISGMRPNDHAAAHRQNSAVPRVPELRA